MLKNSMTTVNMTVSSFQNCENIRNGIRTQINQQPHPPAQTLFLTTLGVLRESTTSRGKEDTAPVFFTEQPLLCKSNSFQHSLVTFVD